MMWLMQFSWNDFVVLFYGVKAMEIKQYIYAVTQSAM